MVTETHRREWLAPKEVARELGVDVRAVYRSVNRNEMPHVRLVPGGTIRIPRSAIERERRP